MLRGEKVVLRALERSEVEQVAGWEYDVETWRQADDSAWVPRTTAQALKDYDEGKAFSTDAKKVFFVVAVDDRPVGGISLWDVDVHNRRAHLGITLARDERGKGYGTDAIRVLLDYAFLDRGLHRVQLETQADNVQALACYRRAGFVEEGRLRDDAWVRGRFVDSVVMSVLSTDPGRRASGAGQVP